MATATPKKKASKLPQQKSSFDLTKFSFLWDYVLVRAIREETTTDGLIKPEQYDDRPEFGEVIAVGTGKVLDDGTYLPMPVKPRDTIFFGKYSSEQTRFMGEDYYLIRAEDVRAVLTK